MADEFTNPEDFFESGEGSSPPMSKAQKRRAKKQAQHTRQTRRNPKPIEARNDAQREYIDSIENNELTFALGPAGVGKTYVPSRIFGSWLAEGRINKIYVARPNVAKNQHRNGHLPGTLEDKTAPWMIPVFEGISDSMSPSEFERMRKEKRIEEVPYEFIQGRTFKNAACIVDEAENLDLDDLYITLTRQGESLAMVVCGDINQARIPNSGLDTVVDMAMSPEMEDIGIVEFTSEEVVRSKQARQWAFAFDARAERNNLRK